MTAGARCSHDLSPSAFPLFSWSLQLCHTRISRTTFQTQLALGESVAFFLSLGMYSCPFSPHNAYLNMTACKIVLVSRVPTFISWVNLNLSSNGLLITNCWKLSLLQIAKTHDSTSTEISFSLHIFPLAVSIKCNPGENEKLVCKNMWKFSIVFKYFYVLNIKKRFNIYYPTLCLI